MVALPSVLALLVLAGVGWLSYLLLWRCLLSPLANIPGPKLAALTYWYECFYDIVKPAQYAFKIKALHEQYGPVVRIGPNDISISDPKFVDVIYAPGPGHKRDKNPKHNRALGVNTSVGGSIAHDLHRSRREALNPFFSSQRIHRLDPDLAFKALQIESLFSRARDSGETINLSDIYFAFCNDIVHRYCFGNDPDLLSDIHLAHLRRTNVASVLRDVKIRLQFGWIQRLTSLLPPGTMARGMMMFRRRIRDEINLVLSRGPLQDEAPSIFAHLRDAADLPTAEKSAQRLEDEAVLMTMAGTYSPMLSLIVAQYHLLARPEIMAKLRAELLANPSVATATELERLPYLSAVAQEAHRLTFGLTGRNPRICPDEEIIYDAPGCSYTFPRGTSLSASTLVIHTDESLFPSPWTFDPDRWLTGASGGADSGQEGKCEYGRDEERQRQSLLISLRRRAMLSFMRGSRTCIGRYLANAEKAVLLAAMARWELELFDTNEEDVSFRHDYHVLCPREGSQGVRVRVKGRCGG
ncbi:cytochrome P450 [Astrocystis sublimbata]|nr:cytochrome P450 [Astrocystis sublimbata]